MPVYGGGGGGGGVTDHGALTGLADDDHPQYHNDARGDARYWPLSTDLATQAELDAHLNDTSDAHDASAISILDADGDFTATDVEGALAELQADAEAHVAAADPHPGYRLESVAITAADVAADVATQAELDAHLNDTTDAHDASAISILDTANDFTATDVEGALAELQSDHEADAQALTDHESDTTAVHGIANTADVLLRTLADAKGDLLVATAADVIARLAVGANGLVLMADSAEATGLRWAAAGGSGADPPEGSYAPGGYTIATGKFRIAAKRQAFTTTQRLTVQGTGRLSVSN